MQPKKRQRGVLKFQQKTTRPPLSREDCAYWLDHLPKILKIGTEFEFNLREPLAVLAAADAFRCTHADQSCVKDCVNTETCLADKHPAFCSTRSSGKFLGDDYVCPAGKNGDEKACKECDKWLLNCRKQQCSSYTPFCTICPSFSRTGQTVENADIRQDADTVRQEMRELLHPTGFVGKVGQSGALDVIKDGSLLGGGIEVPTVGRRVHWKSFHQMCEGIIRPIVHRGGSVNERCGQHFHVLTGYFSKGNPVRINELEKPLPEIVLANLHQLHRRYELAMFWLMSAGSSMEHLTRWARFRQPIYQYSALRHKMSDIQKELARKIVCMGGTNQNGKYASVAYHFCKFDSQGDVDTLHFENRIADGCLSPTVITSWAMMCYALVLKAVRLSQYGIMEVGDDVHGNQVRLTSPHLIDGATRSWDGSRHADTSGIGSSIPWLRQSSRELIQLLKPELHGLGPAFDILMELADKPCSIRLTEGDSWEKIESDLYGPYNADMNPASTTVGEEEVREIIDLAGIVECDHLDAWIEEVSANLGQDMTEIQEAVQHLLDSGQYRWSEAIGSLITT